MMGSDPWAPQSGLSWLARLRQATRHAPRITAACIVGFIVFLLASPLLFYGPTDVTEGTGSLNFATLVGGIPWQIIMTSLLLAIVALIRWWDIVLLFRPIGRPVRSALAVVCAFPLVGVLLFTVLLFQTQDTYHPLFILGLVLCLNLFVGLSEEILFRGILFGALRQKSRLWVAIGVSSLAFGALHVLNASVGQGLAETTFQIVNATALGVLFCALVLQGASLWPAILLHMIWNSYAMLGLAATEFAGEIPTGPIEPAELAAASFILPATIFFIALLMLYQYASRTGNRMHQVVPVAPDPA